MKMKIKFVLSLKNIIYNTILTGLFCSGQIWGQFSGTIRLADAQVIFSGENAGDQAGYHISVIGDVNADGLDDLLIGAPFNDQAGNDFGQVYLILGRAHDWTHINLAAADGSFLGASGRDWASHDVFGIGDVNNDGIDDFAVGVKFVDQPVRNAGKVYIFYGKKTGWLRHTPLENADASFIGEADEYAEAGHVMPVGDVNGDGWNDIIIGAGFNDQVGQNAGKTYLIFGTAAGWGKNLSMAGADASFLGEAAGDNAGHRVAGVGDVNGDGLNDFMIGANGKNYAALVNAGKVYLMLGKTSGWQQNLPLSQADASFIGPNLNQANFGWNLCGAGDVNGDGLDDLLIAAQSRSLVYLVFGKTTGWLPDQPIETVANVTLTGEVAGDHAGYDMRALGDLNGDGYGDIIIGAYGNNQVGTLAGRAYLFYGRSEWPGNIALADADAIFLAEAAGDSAGWSVAGGKGYFITGKTRLGDLNGDGAGDLLIAAPRHDASGADAGKVYLFFGQPPQLKLIIPTGGEIWEIGQYHTISWRTQGDIPRVKIDYSTDNGITWNLIVENLDNTDTYTWLVPEPASEQCRLRIQDHSDGQPADTSDTPFTIRQPASIQVIAPNGGESWRIGSTESVTWESQSASAWVKILLSRDNGINWETCIDSVSNTGTWAWNVTGYPSLHCLIRVVDGSGRPADTSDAVFTIEDKPGITIIIPNGGECWQIHEEYEIRWEAVNIGDSVKIELMRKGKKSEILSPGTPNTGKFLWQVTNPASDSCWIRVQDLSSGLTDTSDAAFSIVRLTQVGQADTDLNGYGLWQNYPNPFNPSTTIRFDLPVAGFAVLKIYDRRGQEIHILLAKPLAAGAHEVVFDAANLPSGVYFYQFEVNRYRARRKMVLLK